MFGVRNHCLFYKPGNILFAIELARRLAGAEVTINTLVLHILAADFMKNYDMVMTALGIIFAWPEAGSPVIEPETSIYLVSSPNVKCVTEKCFQISQVNPAAPFLARKYADIFTPSANSVNILAKSL